MYLDWKVGDRVCCLASEEKIAATAALMPEAKFPRHKGIYTIREIRDDSPYCFSNGTHLVLLLAEIDNSHLIGTKGDGWICHFEPGFSIDAFRKVQPRKTSIAIFEAMLHGNRSEVEA